MRSLIIAATVTGLVACSAEDTSTPAEPPGASHATVGTPSASGGAEPRTEAAVRAAAVEEFDSYAAGDYGATWDVYYAVAKKAISRADYVRLHKLCPDIASGVRFQIDKITMDNDHEAHVRVSRLIAVLTYQFVYEAGHWRFVPDADAMRDYRTKTVQQMVADQRARGACGKQ